MNRNVNLTVRIFFDGPGADRGVTLVKEDEPGEIGRDRGATLVKEGEPGELGGKLGEFGELGELGGPGGIANPAKLSLISFNNFIMPSS